MMNKLIPKIVRWDITGMCNLACLHCYNTKKQPPDLHTSDILNILKILVEHGLSELNLSGREPTMRNDISKIINWCHAHGITVNMSTNGTLLNHLRIPQIASAVHTIVYSVDGACGDTHDRIRGKGNFDRTIRNIKKCISFKINHHKNLRIGVSCTLHNRNFLEMADLISLCKSLGIDFLSVNPVSFCGSAASTRDILYLNPEKILNTWDELCKAYRQYQPSYDLHLGTLPMEQRLMNVKYDLDLPVIQNGCSAGKSLYIDTRGEALPCYMIPPIADVIPEFNKYLKSWKILKEPISTAVEAFEPFIAFAQSHTQSKNKHCINCPEAITCSPCPLYVAYDTESLERCKIARGKLEGMLTRIDDSAIPRIKRNISWKINDTRLSTRFQKGDYESDKEFKINPIARSILCAINGEKNIGEIKKEINAKSLHSSPAKIRYMICDFIKYLTKEGIVEIPKNARHPN